MDTKSGAKSSIDDLSTKSGDSKRFERKKRKKLLKQKKSRIIVRNISFDSNEDIIRDHFSVYGKVIEVNVPKKSNGKMFGYCFVGFDSIISALKAIKNSNASQLLGRTIAVDFAVAKKVFQTQDTPEAEVKTEDNDRQYVGESSKQNDEMGSDGNEDHENSDNEEEDEGFEDENEDKDFDECEPKEKVRKIDPKILNDASEERTLFVRNLSFLTTAESLQEFMSRFGDIEYCKICVDPLTEHSRGTAFVKFRNQSDAQKCLEDDSIDDLFLDSRHLNVSIAVTRNKLKDIQEKRLIKDKDKRNLYLAKEGLIYPDSPAAEGVSQTDLSKRLALETRKRKMLQNNHHFVSKTRLCVHNLPPNYDNKKLRTLFKTAVNDRKSKIIEARIMFDRKADQKFGKSKGFAFVEFAEHIHALTALRHLNNNPNIFSPQKRPIVEFSIENKVALNKRLRNKKKNEENTDNTGAEQDLPEVSIDYSGVMSRPNKRNEKIKIPKVNRKLGEMKKQLKTRGKNIQKNKHKVNKGLKRKQNVEKRKQNKNKAKETQDSHDLHYNKRKDIFKGSNDDSLPNPKRMKWFKAKQ